MLPHLANLLQIEIRERFRRVQDLISLGVCLEQPILDAVVYHLHVVPSARGSDMRIAVLRRERGEDRLAVLHRFVASADHETVAVLESPYAAARAAVDEVDL